MADLTITAKNVRPLGSPSPLIRDFVAAAAGNVGDTVYIDSAAKVQPATAAAAGTAVGIGAVISAANTGQLTFAIGDTVSVQMYGGLTGFTGLTPGANVFLSDTAGKFADAAGTVSKLMGIVLDAGTIFISKVP